MLRTIFTLLLAAAPAFAQFVPIGQVYGPEFCPTEVVATWFGYSNGVPWGPAAPNVWHTVELPSQVPANATHADVRWVSIGTNPTSQITNAYLYFKKTGSSGHSNLYSDQWMMMPFAGFRTPGGVTRVPVSSHKIDFGYWITQGAFPPTVTYGMVLYLEGYVVP